MLPMLMLPKLEIGLQINCIYAIIIIIPLVLHINWNTKGKEKTKKSVLLLFLA